MTDPTSPGPVERMRAALAHAVDELNSYGHLLNQQDGEPTPASYFYEAALSDLSAEDARRADAAVDLLKVPAPKAKGEA